MINLTELRDTAEAYNRAALDNSAEDEPKFYADVLLELLDRLEKAEAELEAERFDFAKLLRELDQRLSFCKAELVESKCRAEKAEAERDRIRTAAQALCGPWIDDEGNVMKEVFMARDALRKALAGEQQK